MRACIIVPTVDLETGAAVGKAAQELAGLPCSVVVAADCELRGDTIPTNAAMDAALAMGADYIALLCDDVTPGAGWLARMIEALEEGDRYGVAAPSGNCRTTPQCTGRPGMEPGVEEVKQWGFFCAVVKRALVEEIGFFDPAFIFWGSDSDYCMRAQAAGWACIWVRDVWMEHAVGGAKGRHPELEVLYREWHTHDRALFRSRWGF